jgi:hypothetical protein
MELDSSLPDGTRPLTGTAACAHTCRGGNGSPPDDVIVNGIETSSRSFVSYASIMYVPGARHVDELGLEQMVLARFPVPVKEVSRVLFELE